jgi:hypothetical protein
MSALFLGDALRSLRRQIQQSTNFEVALSTMKWHQFVMIFHSTTFFAGNMVLAYSFLNPTDQDYALFNGVKIALFLTQSVSQLVIMYLVWKLNSRIVVKRTDDNEEEQTEDTDSLQNLLFIAKEFQPRIRKASQ